MSDEVNEVLEQVGGFTRDRYCEAEYPESTTVHLLAILIVEIRALRKAIENK